VADPLGSDNLDREWLAVRWVRGELAPEEVPVLAVEALARGCDSPSLRLLAGVVGRPTMADVHELVEACFREFGIALPAKADTSTWLVNKWLSLAATGSAAPYQAAHAIALLSGDWWDEPAWLQLRDFIGLASEWEDHPSQRAVIDQQIVECALQLVSAGGFRPS
jgi:hypothetical protein